MTANVDASIKDRLRSKVRGEGAKYKPYPAAYRPSGVEWLGIVPAHWEVQRLRYTTEMRVSNVDKHTKEDEPPVRLCNYVDVYNNERITEGVAFMPATATIVEIDRFRLEIGDVLITKDSETWDDIGVPALVEHAADDLICGYHLALLRPEESMLNGGYLLRALQSPVVSFQFHVEAKGVTRYGLTHSSIRSAQLPIPPLAEQRAIAAFLDRETAKIDSLVSKKERLIELLQEKRAALISRAVTKGIEPDVPMKDSGVEWLGDVPAHWEVRRLKTLCSMKSGDGISAMSIEPVGEYPVYGGNGLRGFTSQCNHDGDFVLIGRQGALCGNVYIARGKFWATEHAVVATLALGHEIVWFSAILTAMNLNQYSFAAAQPGLAVERIMNLHLPLPPLAEQQAIATFLDHETAKLDSLVAKVNQAIELLKEKRTALISAAVTGQIDVREEARCT